MVLVRCRYYKRSMNRALIHRFCSLSTLALQVRKSPQTPNLFHSNHRIKELSRLGRIDEARQLFDKMLHRDAVTWNSMITGYSQNGLMEDAKLLFDAFGGKNVRTWTSLLTGYAKQGLIKEARDVFESMPERNVVSWNAMITGCVQNGDLRNAQRLFDEMPEKNTASWNSLITGYCHSCRMSEARELFDQLEERNSVSWMVMISGYVQINDHQEPWDMFVKMYRSQVRPDQSIFIAALSTIMGLNDLDLIESLRTILIKTGYENDVVVGTSIVNAYSRNGCLDLAMKFFEAMPERNEYSWTSIIAAFSQSGRLDDAIAVYKRVLEPSVAIHTSIMTAYAQNGKMREARLIFDQIHNPNVITWNAMVSGYAQNGMLEEAKDLFLRMPGRNSASWAAMISGLVQSGKNEEALDLLKKLHRLGTLPSQSSFTSSLVACASVGDVEIGKQVHSLTIKTGCQHNSFIGNALISMYASCKKLEDVSQAFSTIKARDIVSWNSLITGLSANYMLDDALCIFKKMPKHDVVSWTAIISAYAQAGDIEAAFEFFQGMLARKIEPCESTFTSLLSACGNLGSMKLGEQMHALVHKLGFSSWLFVCNALITMYFKCGCESGLLIFEEMGERDIVTWNAVLAGCAKNGLGNEAIEVFDKMKNEVIPNHISFLGLLCACSHLGLVHEGWHHFNSMSCGYGLMPLVQHYTCMVELLGRAGRLSEAESLIENMPIEPDFVIWEVLLAVCRVHRNVELGQKVAEKLLQKGTQNSGVYVLLSNIYASQGSWDKVGEIRKLMFDRGVTKEPGISWIQVHSKLYYFLTGDMTHDQIEDIHSALREFYRCFLATGYVPDTNFVLYDVEEDQKQNELLYHSEKLAVTFGILSIPNGLPIRIMKTLRICGDCHTFLKFVSKVTKRKIIIRESNRFHHFQDGLCSCRDYW